MRCGAFIRVAMVVCACGGALAQGVPPKDAGVRGRVVVEPALHHAKTGPLDRVTAEALRTPAQVRRPAGRALHPMVGPLPELKIVLEGEDLRAEPASPSTLVLEGHRFVPPQVLLTRPGAVAIENRHATALTVMRDGAASVKIGPGETVQISLQAGEHMLTVREMPYARGHARVLERGLALRLEDNGDLRFTPLPEGDYSVSFWLGSERLFQPTAFRHNRNSVEFIEATVSANRVVTVTIKDATVQVVAPSVP